MVRGVKVRCLDSLRPQQMRLGWSRVIVSLVGEGPLDVTPLAARLHEIGDAWEARWLAEAGLAEPAPRGTIGSSEGNWRRLARTAIDLGLYREASGRLTDAGHVLRMAAGWVEGQNPFRWDPKARWVGLRTYFAAQGDVLLRLLERWSTATAGMDEVVEWTQASLTSLAEAAGPPQGAILKRQAASKTRDRQIYPIVEPLRDLGYVERWHTSKEETGYRLTPRGVALRGALSRLEADASAILERGLAEATVRAEWPDETPRPDDERVIARILPRLLPRLPSSVLASPHEAPLEVVAVLVQAELMDEAPGAFIELAGLIERLTAVSRRSEGIHLKSGHAVDDLPNLVWGPNAELNTLLSTGAVQLKLVDSADGVPAAEPPAGVGGPTSDGVPAAGDEPVAMVEAFEPVPLWRPTVGARVRLWLQRVWRLLEEPADIGLERVVWEGPASAVARLQRLLAIPKRRLEEKRHVRGMVLAEFLAPSDPTAGGPTLAVLPLARLLDAMSGEPAAPPLPDHRDLLTRLIDDWSHPNEKEAKATFNRAVLARLADCLPEVQRSLIQYVDGWLVSEAPPSAWEVCEAATQALLADVIRTRGREALCDRLALYLRQQPPLDAARRWLQESTGRRSTYTYRQRFRVSRSVWDELCATDPAPAPEIDLIPIGEGQPAEGEGRSRDQQPLVEMRVRIEADSRRDALRKGRAEAGTLRAAMQYDASNRLSCPTDIHSEEIVSPGASHDSMDADESQGAFPPPPGIGITVRALASEAPLIGDVRRWVSPRSTLTFSDGDKLRLALHGLADADGLPRSIERIARAWAAVEQLMASGEGAGPRAMERLATTATLIALGRRLTGLWHRMAEALLITAALEPGEPSRREKLAEWLAPVDRDATSALTVNLDQWKAMPPALREERIHHGRLPRLPSGEPVRIAEALFAVRDTAAAWSAHVEPVAPLVGVELKRFAADFADDASLTSALKRSLGEIAALVQHVYDLRNIVQHVGDAFDVNLLIEHEDTYLRFRALVRPVLAWTTRRYDRLRGAEKLVFGGDMLTDRVRDALEGRTSTGPLMWPRVRELLIFS